MKQTFLKPFFWLTAVVGYCRSQRSYSRCDFTNDLQLLRENLTLDNQKFLDKLQSVKTELSNLIYSQPDDIYLEQYCQKVASLKTEVEQL